MADTAVAGLNMKLVEIATAYQRSRVLCAAARLGVADALKKGERSVQEIAASCAAQPASLHRLLRTLEAMGVVAQSQPDRFVLTELGKLLVKDVANSAWPAVIFWADLLADNWSSLTECVRTGESAASVRPEISKRSLKALRSSARSWEPHQRSLTSRSLSRGISQTRAWSPILAAAAAQ